MRLCVVESLTDVVALSALSDSGSYHNGHGDVGLRYGNALASLAHFTFGLYCGLVYRVKFTCIVAWNRQEVYYAVRPCFDLILLSITLIVMVDSAVSCSIR